MGLADVGLSEQLCFRPHHQGQVCFSLHVCWLRQICSMDHLLWATHRPLGYLSYVPLRWWQRDGREQTKTCEAFCHLGSEASGSSLNKSHGQTQRLEAGYSASLVRGTAKSHHRGCRYKAIWRSGILIVIFAMEQRPECQRENSGHNLIIWAKVTTSLNCK